jgi:rRNA small subunit pseudouridine methyltransferase Nep1
MDSYSIPKLPKTPQEKDHFRRVIVVLEGAPLEITRVGKSKDAKYHLLTSDEHSSILKKHKKDPNEYRPDITHQCLLTLLDSPLNRSGHLQIFIHTQRNVLIEINPKTRIPRTFSRFAGLMVQLLHKLSVKSTGGGEKLLNVIKNPITDHLPTKCQRIGMSGDAKETVRLCDWIKQLPKDEPVVFWVGAISHGEDKFEHAEKLISVSQYPLSASVVCSKICNSFEDLWDIL